VRLRRLLYSEMVLRIGLIALGILYAAKAAVVACSAYFTFSAGTDHVAGAVQIATEEGSAAMDTFLLVGFHGV
jgi:hypothetical protein